MAEHVYRFTAGARGLAARAVAPLGARRPRRLLRLRARGDRPRLGHRGRLHPRPRGPHGRAAGRPRLRLRRRLDPLRRRRRARLRQVRHLVGGELAREGVADLLRVAGRGRGERDVRHPRPPRPRQVLGPAERPWPERDPRYFYEIAMEGIAESGIAVEVSTAGLRKPVGELYPARAFLEMVVDAGNPIALSSDAHAPDDLGRDYDQALALLERARRHASWRSSSAASAGWSRSDDRRRPGIGWDSHRLVRRAPADPRRRRRSRTSSASTATPTPTCSPTRSSTRCWAPPRWATSASTSPTPTSATATPTRCCCCARVVATLAERGLAVAHVDATVVMERPKLAPHRDAIRATLADGLGVDARARQRQGLDRRGDGLRRARRGRRRAGGGDGAEAT